MGYCTECGKELNEDQQFCVHCGATIHPKKEEDEQGQPVTMTKNNENATTNIEPSYNHPKKTKKPMSKWKKVILGTVIILLLLSIGAHKWLESHFDPMKQLIAMDEAISSGDADTFLEYVEFDEEAILDKELFFEYIRDNEWDNFAKEQYLSIIKSEKVESTPFDKEIESAHGDNVLFKLKNKKDLFLYPGFTIHAIPTQVQINSNLSKTTATFQEKEITLKKKEKPSEKMKVYPGEYVVKAKAEGEFGDFTFENEFLIEPLESKEIDIQFDFITAEINPPYDIDGAKLFINGKKSKYKLSDYVEVGPFPSNKKTKLHAEWENSDGKTVRSNTVELKDEDLYGVNFDFDETMLMSEEVVDNSDGDVAEVGQFVLEFRDAYEQAVNNADYSEVEPYFKKGSHAQKDIKGFVADMGDSNYYYDFKENTVTDVKKDGKAFTVNTNEKFSFTDDDGKTYDYDREKKYIVEKSDDAYEISKIDYTDTKKNKVN